MLQNNKSIPGKNNILLTMLLCLSKKWDIWIYCSHNETKPLPCSSCHDYNFTTCPPRNFLNTKKYKTTQTNNIGQNMKEHTLEYPVNLNNLVIQKFDEGQTNIITKNTNNFGIFIYEINHYKPIFKTYFIINDLLSLNFSLNRLKTKILQIKDSCIRDPELCFRTMKKWTQSINYESMRINSCEINDDPIKIEEVDLIHEKEICIEHQIILSNLMLIYHSFKVLLTHDAELPILFYMIQFYVYVMEPNVKIHDYFNNVPSYYKKYNNFVRILDVIRIIHIFGNKNSFRESLCEYYFVKCCTINNIIKRQAKIQLYCERIKKIVILTYKMPNVDEMSIVVSIMNIFNSKKSNIKDKIKHLSENKLAKYYCHKISYQKFEFEAKNIICKIIYLLSLMPILKISSYEIKLFQYQQDLFEICYIFCMKYWIVYIIKLLSQKMNLYLLNNDQYCEIELLMCFNDKKNYNIIQNLDLVYLKIESVLTNYLRKIEFLEFSINYMFSIIERFLNIAKISAN